MSERLEYCKNFTLYFCIGKVRQTHDWVHVVEEVGGLFHGGRHKLSEMTDGEPLHDVVAHLLADDEEECDCHVMVALVVMQLGVFEQDPHDQTGQLVLEFRSRFLLDPGRKSF